MEGGAFRQGINEGEVRRLIQELVDVPRVWNADPTASWVDALSSVRLGLRDPKEVEDSYNGDLDGFASFFPRYRAELAARHLIDFHEMIYLAIELMVMNPELRAHNQKFARVVLADEFQDLNPAHILLLRLLSAPGHGVFGVGDDDQTIFGFSAPLLNGSSILTATFPGAKHHALTTNYRCPADVVRAASNLLTRNRIRVAKTIQPSSNNAMGSDKLSIVSAPYAVQPTISAVQRHLNDGALAEDIVVLTRVNSLQLPVAIGLRDIGIPVNAEIGSHFLDGSGVKAALAWFSLGATGEPFRSRDLEIALGRPSRGVSPKMRR